MNTRRWTSLALAGLAVCGLTLVMCRKGAAPAPSNLPATAASRLAWWREARFGLFIHWGPVSLKGTEISWSRANSNPLCPNKGEIPVEVYDNLYKSFNPTLFDAEDWAGVAKDAGMRYVVLTAKHCDGFCLWPTETIDYHIGRTPFGRDVCGELAEAVRKAGLRIGWYYSPMDWRDPDCRTERRLIPTRSRWPRRFGRLIVAGWEPFTCLPATAVWRLCQYLPQPQRAKATGREYPEITHPLGFAGCRPGLFAEKED